jgi:hypothetical protein
MCVKKIETEGTSRRLSEPTPIPSPIFTLGWRKQTQSPKATCQNYVLVKHAGNGRKSGIDFDS